MCGMSVADGQLEVWCEAGAVRSVLTGGSDSSSRTVSSACTRNPRSATILQQSSQRRSGMSFAAAASECSCLGLSQSCSQIGQCAGPPSLPHLSAAQLCQPRDTYTAGINSGTSATVEQPSRNARPSRLPQRRAPAFPPLPGGDGANHITALNTRRGGEPAHACATDQSVLWFHSVSSIANATRPIRGRQLQQPRTPQSNFRTCIYPPPLITENIPMETVTMETANEGSGGLSDDVTLRTDHQELFNSHMDIHHQRLYGDAHRNLGTTQINTVQQDSNISQQHGNGDQLIEVQRQRCANEDNIPIQGSSGSMNITTIEIPIQQSPSHLSQGLQHVPQGLKTSHQPFSQHQGDMNQENVLTNRQRPHSASQQPCQPQHQFCQSAPVLHPMAAQQSFSQSKYMSTNPHGLNCDSWDSGDSFQQCRFNANMDVGVLNSPLSKDSWARELTPMVQIKEMMVRNYIRSQQALVCSQGHNNETPMVMNSDSAETGLASPNSFRTQSPPYTTQSCMNCQSQINVSTPSSQEGQIQPKTSPSPGGQAFNPSMVPHPPPTQRLPRRRNSRALQQEYPLGPDHTSLQHKRERRINLPCHQEGAPQTHGAIHQQQLLSMGPLEQDATIYPATNQISHCINSLDLERTQVNFEEIIDDWEHLSLMPNIVPNIARTVVPVHCNPLTLQTGMSNMAIGDMDSTLTGLSAVKQVSQSSNRIRWPLVYQLNGEH
ncbi:zinc finger protein GLI1-like [Scyliorhinus canicula]|uniref:zinc finger protein GLI1-like n=1 Tax=Scyliorhinus canicula TaxID=7830 RepID=UPI0018F59CA9|nr:zinc finger protein GLI1-like [Scyliorhinus canicula]